MLPTPILNYSSPYEILYKNETDFNGLKVFCSLCYASTLSTNRRKFDPRASKCVFIGFKRGDKRIFFFLLFNQEKFVSRDIVFYEHIFPYQRVQTSSPNVHDQFFFY